MQIIRFAAEHLELPLVTSNLIIHQKPTGVNACLESNKSPIKIHTHTHTQTYKTSIKYLQTAAVPTT